MCRRCVASLGESLSLGGNEASGGAGKNRCTALGPITAIATGGWNRDFVATASAGTAYDLELKYSIVAMYLF